MGKYGKISIVLGFVALFVVLFYFFGGQEEKKEPFVTNRWIETFDPDDKGPYGTYMLKELMDTANMFGNFIDLDEQIEEGLQDNPNMNDIYFFIGATNYMVDSSAEHLMDFVDDGNTAFIAARSFPYKICEELFYDGRFLFESDFTFDSTQFMKFEHKELSSKRYEFKYIHNDTCKVKLWHYFDTTNFDTYNTTPIYLGTNTQGQLDFVKMPYGDGWFYFHSIPYLFTNISMMKRDGFQHAEHMLEHIPPGRVQWDRYNLEKHTSSANSDYDDESGDGPERRSIMEFILEHPSLTWALIILLIGAVLYVLFKGKRMQDRIPAGESKENTSMGYVKTLAALYMQKGSHAKLIRLKEKTFLNFIAERYYIITNKPDKAFVEKVSIKSQVTEEKIVEIFKMFRRLEGAANVTDDQLIALHRKIEYFYKNCR
ncbi:MAG: hypothetical protein ACI857_002168 [Arenicella sp.]|jgi:hypothetical protein